MTLSELIRSARTANIDESATPHLYEQYHAAMPGIGLVCPAGLLQTPTTATWVKKHGLTVAASSSSELALAMSSGIDPGRLVVFGDQAQWGPIRCAVNAGVRQFVVDSSAQVEILEHHAKRHQQVLVDVTADDTADVVAAVCDSKHLDLVGLHFAQDSGATGAARYAVAVDAMVARLTHVHLHCGIIATRLSLAGPVWNSPRVVAAVIETAVEDSCARHHFPRPSLAFTPC